MNEKIEYTKKMAEYYSTLSYDSIPESTTQKAKELLFDFLGYSSCSTEDDSARFLRATVDELGGNKDATIIGTTQRSNSVLAALVNGTLGHMAELDDTHIGTSSHPGDSIIPSALAVGERVGASGRDFVNAITVGYDCTLRAGYAVMPSHYTRGWHPTGTINVFGAAAAAAKMLGLSTEKMQHTLGLAGAQAAGNFAHMSIRGMTKDFNSGRAASNGVLSALLAQKGFTSSLDIFENARGFLQLYSDTPNPGRLTENLGAPFLIQEVGHKAFPGCFFLHSPREASLLLLEEFNFKWQDVKKIEARIACTGAQYVDDPEPWSGSKGDHGPRFSAQFQIAFALCKGRDGLISSYDKNFMMKALNDPDIRSLMKRIEIIHDDELEKVFDTMWPAVVTIELFSGLSLSKRLDHATGQPENPMSWKELEVKFHMLTAKVFPKDKREAIATAVATIEDCQDIRDFALLLQR